MWKLSLLCLMKGYNYRFLTLIIKMNRSGHVTKWSNRLAVDTTVSVFIILHIQCMLLLHLSQLTQFIVTDTCFIAKQWSGQYSLRFFTLQTLELTEFKFVNPFLVSWPTFFPPTVQPYWPCFSVCGQIHLGPSYLLSGHRSSTFTENPCLPWLRLSCVPIQLHNKQTVVAMLTQW